LGALGLLLLVLGIGCGDGAIRYPVTGKITFNNEPFTAETTRVLFKPDKAKGNDSVLEPVGKIDETGSYVLTTNGKAGAPAGWYRVVVSAHDDTVDPGRPPTRLPVPKSVLPARYGLASSTDLVIEVVANPEPGHYDLKLSP
jgi:hypothetical protein